MTIQARAAQLGIRQLFHFTRVPNLPSIIEHGLVPRNFCLNVAFNDAERHDGTNAICATIDWPNYKTFTMMRSNYQGVEWALIGIKPEVLWTRDCAFCTTNAALGSVSSIPIAQRKNLAAFDAMYAEQQGKPTRAQMGHQPYHPTDPQAEVLIINGVPRDLIYGAYVATAELKNRLEEAHPEFPLKHNLGYFSARHDWRNWKNNG
jgi:hypothetical protein